MISKDFLHQGRSVQARLGDDSAPFPGDHGHSTTQITAQFLARLNNVFLQDA
ncbi:MAG TPA: hypothetical protein VMT29_02120 [Steroidobacteraceae bacterium]|nr:hypothetical protein [Steroidobacteraceae bacterium]